jgi:glycosyltransferase involved in cell wall biosynthesis
MKILWVKTDFLHPTTRGGQIRTLEMLRRLNARHEIHYVALDDGKNEEGVRRASEYCSRAYPIPHRVVGKSSPAFAWQLAGGLFARLPVALSRYRSAGMRRTVGRLRAAEKFDLVVCDFLAPAPNLARLEECVLFQHNVETLIWERHWQTAADPARRLYFRLQAGKMLAYERQVCRRVARVVAVSEADAELMRARFGVSKVAAVPTGVDVDYFTPPGAGTPAARVADLVFVGSMDWLPNIDAINYMLREIVPLIRRRRPATSMAIVGRNPAPEILALARRVPSGRGPLGEPGIQVTGTVPDVRPYLWGSLVSVVPLRIGGGTRLKIYESMAARVPVVATSVGAEGLECRHPDQIRLADTPEGFAEACLELLDHAEERERIGAAAQELVASRFSWEQVARCFEQAVGAPDVPQVWHTLQGVPPGG